MQNKNPLDESQSVIQRNNCIFIENTKQFKCYKLLPCVIHTDVISYRNSVQFKMNARWTHACIVDFMLAVISANGRIKWAVTRTFTYFVIWTLIWILMHSSKRDKNKYFFSSKIKSHLFHIITIISSFE